MLPRLSRALLAAAGLTLVTACAPVPPETETLATSTHGDPAVLAELVARYEDVGTDADILFWTEAERRTGFANIRDIYPTRTVAAGDSPRPLPRAERDLAMATYLVDDQTFSLDDFLAMPDSMGLIVVQDGQVLFEDYAQGHGPETPWMSFSVTKSVTSMLIGAAIEDGYIQDVNDPVTDYLPRLKETAYADVTVAHVLQMASGVAWNEDYRDKASDVSRAGGANGMRLYRYLADLPRAGAPGEVFNYNTGESNLAGALLRAAVGNNASSYLQEKIWQPFGMAADAYWVTTPDSGAELGGCCLNATLRDYARLGLFALSDGVLPNGERVLPEGWMARSTAPSPAQPRYGYLWWLAPGDAYVARGIFGQVILVDPANDLVIALHSNASSATRTPYADHVSGLLHGLRQQLAR